MSPAEMLASPHVCAIRFAPAEVLDVKMVSRLLAPMKFSSTARASFNVAVACMESS